MTGALVMPLDVTVIWAVPTPLGVHTTGTVRLSQVPAQTAPFVATLAIDGALEVHV